MKQISFLGTGAMGSRMAQRLLDKGYKVTLWNRTPERAKDLVEKGAVLAVSPKEAVKNADIVFSMVRDDNASAYVWLDQNDGALSNMKVGAIGIECSTLTIEHIQNLSSHFKKLNIGFLDAPVAGSRPQAEAGKLIFLVGGKEAHLQCVSVVLESLAEAIHHVGDNGSGSTLKLMINALLGVQLALLAELIGFARKSDMDVQKAINVLTTTPVCSPAAKLAANAMLEANFTPAFPIELVAKDFAMIMQSAESLSALMPISSATKDIYQEAVKQNLGDNNITGIVQLYSP